MDKASKFSKELVESREAVKVSLKDGRNPEKMATKLAKEQDGYDAPKIVWAGGGEGCRQGGGVERSGSIQKDTWVCSNYWKLQCGQTNQNLWWFGHLDPWVLAGFHYWPSEGVSSLLEVTKAQQRKEEATGEDKGKPEATPKATQSEAAQPERSHDRSGSSGSLEDDAKATP